MKKILTILIMAFPFFSCNQSMTTKLPEKPDSLSIIWSANGGMMYYYERLQIDGTSCKYEINKNGSKQNVNFNIEQKQLDDIYNVMRKNAFDKIKSNERPVVDRGGTGIQLKVNGKLYHVSNSGINFIDQKYVDNYNSIENFIINFKDKELQKLKKDVTIIIDSTLLNPDYTLVLYINGDIVLQEKDIKNIMPIKTSLLKENNTFSLIWGEYKKDEGYTETIKSFKIILENLPTNEKITLKLNDSNEMVVN